MNPPGELVEKDSYSQKEVSDYLGLHYSIISRWLKKNQLQFKHLFACVHARLIITPFFEKEKRMGKFLRIVLALVFSAVFGLTANAMAKGHKHSHSFAKRVHKLAVNNAVSNLDDDELEIWLGMNKWDGKYGIFYAIWFGVEGGDGISEVKKIQIKAPNGKKFKTNNKLAFSGLEYEAWGMEFSEFEDNFPEGKYSINASSETKEMANFDVAYDFPSTPIITYPNEGDTDIPTSFTIEWEQLNDNDLDGLWIFIESVDGDDLEFEKELSLDATSFTFSDGLLNPNTEYQVGINAFIEDDNGERESTRAIFFTTGSVK